jgi:uncharacterized membrane protein
VSDSVELLILRILPIVVVFVLLPTLYLVIKWTVSSALRGVSSAFREASAGDHTARQIVDERYARGKNGCEEYEQVGRDIQAE